MKKKKESLGIISAKDLMVHARGKSSRQDDGVKNGVGYHKSARDYNRKGKANQRLKNKLKNYGSEVAFCFLWYNKGNDNLAYSH